MTLTYLSCLSIIFRPAYVNFQAFQHGWKSMNNQLRVSADEHLLLLNILN